ncbi:MAG: beta-ketoacyl synthase chain length factor [Lentisphaeraceae bacterium]|nr:beta-ketoacyl synthase chain length factor [Lentisphaeraceae bacterium]
MKIPLKDWRAWAPGIEASNDWLQYIKGDKSLDLSQKPDVSFLPPMFRRKLSLLSRMIFSTVHSLEENNDKIEAPLVLATRHGELDLSIDLIHSEITESPFSPAKFSMSVHNSPVGLLSIHSKNKLPNTAISAGKKSLEMGLYEATAMLSEHKNCLLIYADQELSEVYKEYKDDNDIPACLVILLNKNAPLADISFESTETSQVLQFVEQAIDKRPSEANC